MTTDFFKFNINRSLRHRLLFRYLPNILMELMNRYFRLETVGVENIPEAGASLIIPNHSGYSGLDAMILSHEIYKHKKRIPKVLTHHLWFSNDATGKPASKMGFIEATMDNALRELKNNQLVVLFPEGERGNFKPSKYAYRLQHFKRGFVRMSLETRCTITPTIVIGAEETHINLKKIKFGKLFNNLSLPIPFNIVPLPVKWKIIFLPSFSLPFPATEASNTELVHEVAEYIQELMQKRIDIELAHRPGVFINRPDWLDQFIKNLNFKWPLG